MFYCKDETANTKGKPLQFLTTPIFFVCVMRTVTRNNTNAYPNLKCGLRSKLLHGDMVIRRYTKNFGWYGGLSSP